ncbi:2-C-methyl-D-erythritol 2,4-cyclodiphosphate synthase [Candidatus Moduliflexus flocculans]|uniref:2-C-methyl-D-erythritol 2,4-cyclodiphosphate synthase n=1 Tax=Candidatus Moduliflexus flocculans TaxID=1499966 RepID=A0A0S6VTH4_9BACT|nr:2-C-methyl-D-erythritol 2,4-cyclodiphosphate synthase [Candidatus Moduliflexus flocculans]
MMAASLPFRVGIGYDVHRLVPDRDLVLGGVKIPYEKGLLGHSDADVLIHAICDALLGALGLGDIGRHFPDTDAQYKGISSIKLLKHCVKLIQAQQYIVGNVDSVVIAQKPRLSGYIEAMRLKLAQALETEPENVNVKATTTEGLGFTGTGDGIAAEAIVQLIRV